MIPDLIRLLLEEGTPAEEVNELAARIEAEAEREGMMLRRAPRRFASGGRLHKEDKYDRAFNKRDDAKKQLKKVASAEAIPEGCVPVAETPIREILPVRVRVQDTLKPKPALVKPKVSNQFRKMQARRFKKG